MIRFIPPLIISRSEVDLAITVLDDALGALESGEQDLSKLMPRNNRSGPVMQRMHQRLSAGRVIRGMCNSPPKDWVGKFKKL